MGLLTVVSTVTFADDRLNILPLERQLQADQRGIISLRFEVENRSGKPQELYEQLRLAPSWSLITTAVPFTLQAGERQVRLQHILIPANSAAGQFPVTYQLTSTRDSNLQQQTTVNVTVARKTGSSLEEVMKPTDLLPGEPYEVAFQLLNNGNTAQAYTIKLRNGDKIAQSLSTNTINLEPDSAEVITVNGQIPTDFQIDDTHRFSLIVYSGDDVLEKEVSIPIISMISDGVGTHHKLQGELRVGFQAKSADVDTEYDTNIQYRTRGALDDAGKHKIAVQLNAGQNSEEPYDGMVDEYKINYEYEEWRAKAGNQGFYTDRLIGNSVNGEGIEVEYRPEDEKGRSNQSLRAFYAQSDSDAEQDEKAIAIIGKHRFDEQQLEIGASLLHHESNLDDVNVEKNIAGANARWSGEASNIYAAVAHDGDQQAITAEGGFRWNDDLSTNLSYLRSDPGFAGENPDAERVYLASQWKINDRTRLNVSARQSKTNLDEDMNREIRKDTEHQVRLSHTLGESRDTQIGIGLRQQENRDMRELATTHRKTTTGLLSYQRQFDAVSIKAELEAGQRIDQYLDQEDTETNGSRQQLTMSWKPDQGTLLSADYNRQVGLDNNSETQSIGLRSQYQLDNRTKVAGYVQHNMGEQDQSTQFNISLDKDLRQQRRLSVQLTHQQNYDSLDDSNDQSVYVDYVMPLDIPLRRRDDIASLCGKLVYANSSTPASAMVLHLGQHTTVADARGKFCFSNVLAKTYQLQLDVARLKGKSYILGMEGTSRTVTLDAGEEKNLDIALHPAASVRGTLQRMEFDLEAAAQTNSNQLKQGAGIGNVIINLSPVEHAHLKPIRRTTDARGNFNILGIPPGQWRLSIATPEKLPKHYFLEQNSWELDLQADRTKTLNIHANPAQQGIEKTGPGGGFSVEG